MADINWDSVKNYMPSADEKAVLFALRDTHANSEALSQTKGLVGELQAILSNLLEVGLIREIRKRPEKTPKVQYINHGPLQFLRLQHVGYGLTETGEQLLRRMDRQTGKQQPSDVSEAQATDALHGAVQSEEIDWSTVDNFRPSADENLVLVALRDGPLKPQDLTEATGIESATIRKTIGELLKESLISEETMSTGRVNECGGVIWAGTRLVGYRLHRTGEHLLRRLESESRNLPLAGDAKVLSQAVAAVLIDTPIRRDDPRAPLFRDGDQWCDSRYAGMIGISPQILSKAIQKPKHGIRLSERRKAVDEPSKPHVFLRAELGELAEAIPDDVKYDPERRDS